MTQTLSPTPSARTWWPNLRRNSTPRPRFRGLDAARGLAVIGMVISHAVAIPLWEEGPGAWLGLVNGRSSILFATIAGVSLTLLSGGSTRPTGDALPRVRMRILGRSLALMVFAGILSLFPTSISLILASYALWFALALPALTWSVRTLLLFAGAGAVVGPALNLAVPYLLTLAGASPSGTNAFVVEELFYSIYPAVVWMSYVFAGMALGRCGLDNLRALRRFLVAGLALFIFAAAPFVVQAGSPAPLLGDAAMPPSASSSASSQLPSTSESREDWPAPAMKVLCVDLESRQVYECPAEEAQAQFKSLSPEQREEYDRILHEWLREKQYQPQLSWQTLWTIAPHSNSPFEALSSGGLALALISGLVLIGHRAWSRWILWPLSGLGAMALTAYCLHVVVLAIFPPNYYYGDLPGWLLILGLVAGSACWMRWFASGPLEQFTAAFSERLAGLSTRRSREDQSS